MSKSGSNASVAVTVLFNIAVWVAPGIKDEYRPFLFFVTMVLLAGACVWWWFEHRTSTGLEMLLGTQDSRSDSDIVIATEGGTASKISTGSGTINAPVAGRDNIGTQNIYHAHPAASSSSPATASKLTVKGILEEIRAAPPYQRHAISKNYEGIYIKWKGTISRISPSQRMNPTEGDIQVLLRADHPDSFYSISFEVSVDTYPKFKIAETGGVVWVSGTIKTCSDIGMYIEINIADIEFPDL
jgi:hypothetical protein